MLPFVFKQSFALSMLSQMGIAIIFALSYNMLLGQTGLLSFGHAVYFGLGAFFCAHALNFIGAGKFWFPVTLLPLVGGLAGLVFGLRVRLRHHAPRRHAVRDDLARHRRNGGGQRADVHRVLRRRRRHRHQPHRRRHACMGISYGPQIQVYYLIAGWCLVCMIAMFALTQTPLGRMANAVRDNPERAKFVGYNPTRVRWLMMSLAGFFAGIGGGLAAINYEIVTAENAGRGGLRQRRDDGVHRRRRPFLGADHRRGAGDAFCNRRCPITPRPGCCTSACSSW